MAKKKYYAVRKGHQPGIYNEWFGPRGAQAQIMGFSGAVYRGFATRGEAEAFLSGKAPPVTGSKSGKTAQANMPGFDKEAHVVVYTDGGALGNPGPGGYGVVILRPGERPLELSGGFRLTTNNRMELMACIVALEQLDGNLPIVLHSDSRYMVDAINKKWVFAWEKRGWKKADGQPAKNPDLWQRLLKQLARHRVVLRWVKGHAGEEWNERCDALAGRAMAQPDLPADAYYESQANGG